MNFFHYLSPGRLPGAGRQRDPLAAQREILLQRILNILLALYTIGLPIVLIFTPQVIRSGKSAIYIGAYLFFAAITLIRSIPYHFRAGVVVLILQALGIAALLSYGLSGTGMLFLFGAALSANMLFTQRTGGVFILLSLAIIAVTGGLMTTARIAVPPNEVMANSANPSQWITFGLVFIFLISITTGSIVAVVQGLMASLRRQETLTHELEEEQASLERRVEERSTELKTRAAQYEVASQIARDISAEVGLENILNSAVNRIRDQFGFYHVGIFLRDRRGEYAELRAATGDAGRQMLERSHRLRIGEVGIVGYVVNRGEARIAHNVESDTVHYKNPLLPETRSEVALPLRAGGETIGALDVQSVLENAFSQDDIRILQLIADQIAIAFRNARLLEDLQRSLTELETSHSTATQKAWNAHLANRRQKSPAYRYHNAQVEAFSGPSEHSAEILETGHPILRVEQPADAGRQPFTVLAVPIKLRNQILGVVDIHFEGTNISPDLVKLVQGSMDRLAVSLENARLLEEIQIRADRERTVGDISAKVRAAADVDTVLRIAAQEIGRTLGVSEVMVQLRKESENP
jgi:GAF domain-containing protein